MKLPVIVVATVFLGAASTSTGAQVKTYANIFDYCAAVGTQDDIDLANSITGALPIKQAMAAFGETNSEAFGVAEGFSPFVWRCAHGKVLVCAKYGGYEEYCGRADISPVATKEVSDYCRRHPNDDVIPLAVTGHHSTMYEFTCRRGVATATRKLFTPDERGFQPDLWREIDR
jgi:hypothetical protein